MAKRDRERGWSARMNLNTPMYSKVIAEYHVPMVNIT